MSDIDALQQQLERLERKVDQIIRHFHIGMTPKEIADHNATMEEKVQNALKKY